MTGEFTRFCVVGMINTIHHYVWYVPLCRIATYEAANTVAFLLAMIGSFYLNAYLTFRTIPSLRKFLAFPVTYVPQLVTSYLVPYICIRYWGINPYIVPILSTLITLPLTFTIMRILYRAR